MQTLTDPILHDVARIIERHPDLTPGYKSRLLTGLATIDNGMKDNITFDGETAKDYADRRLDELGQARAKKGAK